MNMQGHFEWLQEKVNQLGTATNTPAHTEELASFSDKLQKLAPTLHPHPMDRPVDEPIHKRVQQYTETLCAT